MAKKWKEVGAYKQATQIIINEDKGDVTEGIYQGRQEHVGENDSQVHYIEIDGELCSFWGSAVLDARLASVQVGDEVRITYKGKAKSKTPGRKGYHDYTIEVAEDDGSEEEEPAPKAAVKPVKKTVPTKAAETEEGEGDEDLPF